MFTSWHDLLANFSVIAVLVAAWPYIADWLESKPAHLKPAVQTVMGAGGAIAVMSLPFEIQPGVIIDLRSTVITLAGFVGGPVVGIATGAIVALYRLWLGGAGAFAGMIGIGIATVIGIGFHLYLRGRTPTPAHVFFLALSVAVGGILGFFALPQAIWMNAIPAIGPSLATLLFLSVLLTGLALVQDARRRERRGQRPTGKSHASASSLPCKSGRMARGDGDGVKRWGKYRLSERDRRRNARGAPTAVSPARSDCPACRRRSAA